MSELDLDFDHHVMVWMARNRMARLSERGLAVKRAEKRQGPRSYVYFVETPLNCAIKIGTAQDVDKRVASLQTAHPVALNVLLTVPGGRGEESILHARFNSERLHGEWFRGDGVLRSFIASLLSISESERVAEIRKLPPEREDQKLIELEIARGERLVELCKQFIREYGVARTAEALTKRWGPLGRPVSERTIQGVLDGKFNLRAEWLHWLSWRSPAIRSAMEPVQ